MKVVADGVSLDGGSTWLKIYAYDSKEACEMALAKQEQGEPKKKWEGQIDNDEFFESLKQEQRSVSEQLNTECAGEPVAMRMPKVGDRVVCIEDEDLGTVQSLTAGGSPDIKFDDGSHGTYLLREFSELFRYADTTPQQRKPLTDEQIKRIWESLPFCNGAWETFARAIEAAHGIAPQKSDK